MMLVSSIGYFKNNTDNLRRVENNKIPVRPVTTKGLPAGYKANGEWDFSYILRSLTTMFNSQSKLRKRALDMIA